MAIIANELYRFDDFELQPSRRYLLRGGEKVPLAPKTFEVLLCLVQRPGQVVLKEELLRAVWPDSFVEESNLTQHVFWLRKALGDRSGYVVTIPGRGYEFTGKVAVVPEGQPSVAAAPVEATAAPVTIRMEQTTERTQLVYEEEVTAPAPARRLWLGLACGLLLLAVAGGWGWQRWRHRIIPGDHHEVVIADVENSTGDPGFDRALNTLLAIDLNDSPYLVVAGEEEVRHIFELMNRPPQESLTPVVAREVCQRLNDQAVLSGAIARFGQKYVLTLAATDCQTGAVLAQTKAVADSADGVIKAVDSVATEMRERLGERLHATERPAHPLQLAHTFSLDALKVYSEAHALELALKYQEAIPLYKHAIELDPRFAVAYSGLANCFYKLGEADQQIAAITKAYQLHDQADDQQRLEIDYAYHSSATGDLPAVIRDLQAWTEMYPSQIEPWVNLADMQRQIGHSELAIAPAKRAIALDPARGDAYELLSRAQLATGRLDEAEATCRQAIDRKVDGSEVHVNLLRIAWLRQDMAGVNAQIAWAHGKRSEPKFTLQQALMAFAQGKARAGIALFHTAMDQYRKAGVEEWATRLSMILPRVESDLGLLDEARKQLATLDPKESRGFADTMVALAATGQVDLAEGNLKHTIGEYPEDTEIQYFLKPEVAAAIALARNQPQAAIAALDPARAFDLHDFTLPALRGRAYLAAKRPADAEREFRNILAHPGAEPLAFNLPLAHLGLARALELEGNHAASRQEYETLFALWKEADADLPPLVQARAEYSRIP